MIPRGALEILADPKTPAWIKEGFANLKRDNASYAALLVAIHDIRVGATPNERIAMKLNYDGNSFWEWYAKVTYHLHFGHGRRAPLPTGDVEHAEPSSIEAMFNCNYDPIVAAQEIAKQPEPQLCLKDAATLALRVMEHIISDDFAKGGDIAARRALRFALAMPVED